MIIDKNYDGGFPSDLFNRIKVSKGIHLIESTIYPHARAGPSVVDSPARLALQLSSSTLPPLLEKGVFMLTAAVDLIVCLALAPATRGRTGRSLETKDGSTSSANAVPPLALARQFIVPGIGNDTLDTSGTTTVKGSWRELDLRGASASEAVNGRHTHSGVDLVVAEGVFFGYVLVRLEVRVVAVFRVEGLAMGVLGEQVVELFLGGSRHDGQVMNGGKGLL